MASATKGACVDGSVSMHEFQQPSSISSTIDRFLGMSPRIKVFILGIRPGFLTMY